jgi:hypothetical protein
VASSSIMPDNANGDQAMFYQLASSMASEAVNERR